jgi:SseB protein N-terminal domain
VSDPRFDGVQLPTSPFAGDDGGADPNILKALESGQPRQIAIALRYARLLVPIVSVLEEEEVDAATGLSTDKSSHMANVLMVAPDGRRGLLAFTSTETMGLWDPQARPAPALGPDVAQSALDQGADAVLIDFQSAHRYAVLRSALEELARHVR